ncbi:MAG TPA: discoidin domain-containing protein [Catenuloplanes sp.]
MGLRRRWTAGRLSAATVVAGLLASLAVGLNAAPAQAATDLAAGRPATADSAQTGRSAALGNDGSPTTRWCAANGALGHWWQVDLGTAADLTSTQVSWEFARNYRYRISVSSDAATWTTAVDQTASTSSAKDRTDTFTARARYVRVTVTGLPAGTWASLFEFRAFGTPVTGAALPVTINVDAAATRGPLKPIYRFFGADEPNYAYMPDGKKLLGDIGGLGAAPEYFRAHSMMVTGDGTPGLKWGSTNMYTEDAQGRPIYDWTIVDRIFDTYLENGVRPFAQIGFMPKALSTRPEPYQHNWKPGDPYSDIYTGWAYPPKDYDKWRELVYQWVKHSVERYGKAEVEQWYWEVWNEPNQAKAYWQGTPAEFHKLHDYAIDGVLRALPTAKVGGPDAQGSGGTWMRDFLTHTARGTNYATGQIGTKTDFTAFHPKGSPTYVNGHVRMGISNHLRVTNDGFRTIASFPEYKSKPIVLGESDPDGCAACSAAVYPQNAYRNKAHFASYTAASFARKHQLADRHGVNLEGAVTWSFEFEDQPIFAGFRVMSTEGGINVPAFNTFRMMGKMTGERLAVTSTHEIPLDTMLASGVRGAQPDVTAMAALDDRQLSVLAWNYHDDDVPGPDAAITVPLRGLPAGAAGGMRLTEYRIDDEHSNAYTAWQRMGSPATPTAAQLTELRAAGMLQTIGAPVSVPVTDGTATVRTQLPRQGVSLLVLTW